MDLSAEYIKMCSKAKEIQNNHSINKFDLFQDSNSKDIFSYDDNMMRKYIGTWIWLPKQDQLQEMIFSADKRIRTEYCLLQDPESDNNYDLYHYSLVFSGDSIEQCWLKVVMKEKYNKTWNGEDWI